MNQSATFRVGMDKTEQVFPCRCGVEHQGPFAEEEYRHHNCFHTGEWAILGKAGDGLQLICGDCGFGAIAYPIEHRRR